MSGIICILIFIFLFAVPLRKRDAISILNKQDMDGVRGLFAIAIIIHHVSQMFDSSIGNTFISLFFFSYVGVFYMLSGYGLSVSLDEKENYLHNFMRKKIFEFLGPYIIALASEIILAVSFFEENVTLMMAAQKCGWFVKSIMGIYIIWYIAQKISKNHKDKLYICLIMGIFIYIIVCLYLNLESFWYSDVFSFFLGVVIYHNRNFAQNKSAIRDKATMALLTAMILICWLYVFFFRKEIHIPGIGMASLMWGGVFLSCFWYLLMKHYEVKNKIWKIVGRHSLEIYLFGETSGIIFRLTGCIELPCIFYYLLCLIAILLETYLYVRIVGFLSGFWHKYLIKQT